MMTRADIAGRVRHRWRNYWLRRTFQNGEEFVAALGGGPDPTVAVLRNGRKILHPDAGGFLDVMLECWYRRVYLPRGFYRPAPRGATAEVVVDVGANVGLFSLQMLLEFPRVTVHAFEPFAANFQCLSQNLAAAAPATRWHAYRVALAGTTGRGVMSTVGGRSLDHTLQPDAGGSAAAIETLSLAALFPFLKVERIGYLKVDIEGSEKAVFESAAAGDLRRVDHFACEYHDHLMPGTLSLLQERLAPTHEVKVDPSPLPGCGMLYARRR